MSRKNRTLVALLVGGIVWLAYWFFYGRDLTYDVFSGDRYWYTERFSWQGKVIITSLVALSVSLVTWFCLPKKTDCR